MPQAVNATWGNTTTERYIYMETNTEQYQKDAVKQLSLSQANGNVITADDVAVLMLPGNNGPIKVWAFANGITKTDLDKAMHRKMIKDELGFIPQKASELIDYYVKRDGVIAKVDGTITPTQGRWADNELFNITDMVSDIREIKYNLKLPFADIEIADQVTKWTKIAKNQRIKEIIKLVNGQVISKEDEWKRLANACFVISEECPLEYCIAVLKKFIWQVKRKMNKLPVTRHLAIVITGEQEKGKTTFMELFLSVLSDVATQVSFKDVTDDRNIDIWSRYVLVTDEMSYASKADIETLKRTISAQTLTRRILYTNGTVEVRQNATFIGASNKLLSQMIFDPTGMRRFAALPWRSDALWEVINEMDWLGLWNSVDAFADDPILPVIEILRANQENEREPSQVELWLAMFSGEHKPNDQQKYSGEYLYDKYRDWAEKHYPNERVPLNICAWGNEMRRIAAHEQEKMPFHKKRSGRGMEYYWVGIGGCMVEPDEPEEETKQAVRNAMDLANHHTLLH